MNNLHFLKKSYMAFTLMTSISLLGCGSSYTTTGQYKGDTGMQPEANLSDASTNSNFSMTTDSAFEEDYAVSENLPTSNTESYNPIFENPFIHTLDQAFSTFSIDVDTASYSNVRRFINDGTLPPSDAVRTEELVNYFHYDYPQPEGNVPFSLTQEMIKCPWNPEHNLLLVGLQGKNLDPKDVPPSNLVFLLDVSGSMDEPNKLPLLKKSFSILTSNLKATDTVSIVVYAGASGIILDGAKGNDEATINHALSLLEAGGSTAGAEGIDCAYELAQKYFIHGGNNRVILATDGDFNVGPSSEEDLARLIESKRDQGIFLSVLGLGMGNHKDSMLEGLADKGNGNYAYIDTLQEAKKVLGEELNSTLFTIAKDVKIQVEFNPYKVDSYRLIGYENRLLTKEDFDNDLIDAGEIGAGHCVTALYEILPASSNASPSANESACYEDTDVSINDEYGLLKLRYKAPNEDNSQLLSTKFSPNLTSNTQNITFAGCVAEYSMLLRNSEYKGSASFENVLSTLKEFKNLDSYQSEFYMLVSKTQALV